MLRVHQVVVEQTGSILFRLSCHQQHKTGFKCNYESIRYVSFLFYEIKMYKKHCTRIKILSRSCLFQRSVILGASYQLFAHKG